MKKFLKTFTFAFGGFLLIIALGGYFFLGAISKGQGLKDGTKPNDKEIVNVLIIGVDAKDQEGIKGSRSDTIMVASYNPKTKSAKVISIPRDTRVTISGKKGLDKINHAHAYGGIEGTISTVENFLGLDLHYYFKIDYKGMSKIVDDIGGVTVDVPIDMKYNDPYADPPLKIDIKKGKQTLNSDKALQFVRFRKGYSDQDIGRINAQHTFMLALADKLLGPSTVLKLPKLLETFSTYVETDMSPSVIASYAVKAPTIKLENIQMLTIPGQPKQISGVWYYIPNKEEMKLMVQNINSNTKAEEGEAIPVSTEEEKGITVEVLNGSNVEGLATRVSKLLEKEGYKVGHIGNVSGMKYNETHIYDRKNQKKDAKAIAKILGLKEYESDINMEGNIDISIIVGNDLSNIATD